MAKTVIVLGMLVAFSPISFAQQIELPERCECAFDAGGNIGYGIGDLGTRALSSTEATVHVEMAEEWVQETPWILRVFVGKSGVPCGAEQLRAPVLQEDIRVAALAAIVDGALRLRFKPFLVRGRPACFVGRMFVYIRSHEGNVNWIIPGITDAQP